MAEAKENLVERVVVGKAFSCLHPETGERVSASPGSVIKVRAATAAANPGQLVAKSVAEAQAKAKEAEEAAMAEVAKEEQKAAELPKAGAGAGSKES